MPRASWAINRFLIFSPSISWVSVSDGWCDRGRRLHKFRILNTKSASGCWGLGARSPSSWGGSFMGTLWPSPAPPEVQPLMWSMNRQWDHMPSLAQEGSIWTPGSRKMEFKKARDLVQGHVDAEMNLWCIDTVLWVSFILQVGAISPFWIWENWASDPLSSLHKVTRSARGRGEVGTIVGLYTEFTFFCSRTVPPKLFYFMAHV